MADDCVFELIRERQVKLFRQIVTVMGRSPFHHYLFFKFQSATTTASMCNLAHDVHSLTGVMRVVSVALEAFPDTRWSFVFRDSVQTMMSHLDPSKVNSTQFQLLMFSIVVGLCDRVAAWQFVCEAELILRKLSQICCKRWARTQRQLQERNIALRISEVFVRQLW